MAPLSTDAEMLSLPSLEDLTSTNARSIIIPYIIHFSATSPPPEHPLEVRVMVDATNRSITFIEVKEAPLPATKTSIESMPVVSVFEQGIECAICLLEFEVGDEAKEMPCTHNFHSNCVAKWLGINGSCPICRYKMPIESAEDEVMFTFDVIVNHDFDNWDFDLESDFGDESTPEDMVVDSK
ncbi:uncharacterized protein LOC107778694 [Nicotiana tabacum]|uniref:RING-type E3 ubiquitin transferase n=2 Tax=Nicotiana TaxID=4085 RepID=A0A1S3YQZ6_TOBAC|nr:PREDICTED: uncharacterized RING finger protein P32A8.03c-like [Nicotiana sylvestris]XP_016454467.1 PREDICTED: uncharacterized RING finger protein P32A8.03c-like [Nicotiana tabacum]